MHTGVVIPTRNNRPRFFNQCLNYLNKQTRKPDLVEIVNYPQKTFPVDLTERYKFGCEILVKKGAELVFFIEDDDWYAQNYIETMISEWNAAGRPEIFGIGHSLYYHIISRQKWLSTHEGRASACCTLLKASAIEKVNWEKIDPLWTDIGIWEQLGAQGKTKIFDKFLVIGIKHGFGSTFGAGHRRNFYGRRGQTEVDVNYIWLRSQIGSDTDFYLEVARSNRA